jgi:hypothetical protein
MPLINNETNQCSDSDSGEENVGVESEKVLETTVDENKKTALKTFKSACGNDIIIKKRNSRSKPKPIIIFEEDLYGETQAQQIIVKKKPTKGRPKKPKPIVEYVNEHGETIDKDDSPEQIVINKPKKEKLSAKDLKMLQLQEKILELETVSGKTIRGTKKGNIDKRQTKPPTEKQLLARKKFVENNKLRNEAKKAKKLEQNKIAKKDDVKIVIDELQELKKKSLDEKKQAMDEKEKIRQELLAEQKLKTEPKVVKNSYDEFM